MIKKILKILAIVIVAALIVIQFFRIDKNAPAVVQAETIQAAVAVPPDSSEEVHWRPFGSSSS